MNDYREAPAGRKPLKRAYVAVMLWFVGRALQVAARADAEVRREFEALPEGFTFAMGVLPAGPWMIVGKRAGRIRYLGWRPEGIALDLTLKIKHLEAAILMFTFRESTAVATARNRMIVDGEVPPACAIVRILDIVEVYLLPKFIARLAVKRYPRWSWTRKLVGRTRIYLGAVLGR